MKKRENKSEQWGEEVVEVVVVVRGKLRSSFSLFIPPLLYKTEEERRNEESRRELR